MENTKTEIFAGFIAYIVASLGLDIIGEKVSHRSDVFCWTASLVILFMFNTCSKHYTLLKWPALEGTANWQLLATSDTQANNSGLPALGLRLGCSVPFLREIRIWYNARIGTGLGRVDVLIFKIKFHTYF